VIKEFGEYPESAMPFEEDHMKSSFFSYDAVSNEPRQRLMVFYNHTNLIQIFDFNGVLLKEVSVGDYIQPQTMEKRKLFFAAPVAVKDNIFVLYLDETREYLKDNAPDLRPQLHVYDWNGNLLSQHQLDAPVYNFAINEKTKKLVGGTFWEDGWR